MNDLQVHGHTTDGLASERFKNEETAESCALPRGASRSVARVTVSEKRYSEM